MPALPPGGSASLSAAQASRTVRTHATLASRNMATGYERRARQVKVLARPSASGGGVMPVDLSGRLSTELHELLDDVLKRLRGIDLVTARLTQERFYLGQVAENESAVF